MIGYGRGFLNLHDGSSGPHPKKREGVRQTFPLGEMTRRSMILAGI